MDEIHGVRFLDLRVFDDGRGELVAFEQPVNLPFELRRVFYMKVDDSGIRRGEHATSSDLFLTVVTGSVVVDVDNGEERATLMLASRDRGLWIRPGIYLDLRNFKPGTVLLVCASAHYQDTRYFSRPQPHLFEEHALA